MNNLKNVALICIIISSTVPNISSAVSIYQGTKYTKDTNKYTYVYTVNSLGSWDVLETGKCRNFFDSRGEWDPVKDTLTIVVPSGTTCELPSGTYKGRHVEAQMSAFVTNSMTTNSVQLAPTVTAGLKPYITIKSYMGKGASMNHANVHEVIAAYPTTCNYNRTVGEFTYSVKDGFKCNGNDLSGPQTGYGFKDVYEGMFSGMQSWLESAGGDSVMAIFYSTTAHATPYGGTPRVGDRIAVAIKLVRTLRTVSLQAESAIDFGTMPVSKTVSDIQTTRMTPLIDDAALNIDSNVANVVMAIIGDESCGGPSLIFNSGTGTEWLPNVEYDLALLNDEVGVRWVSKGCGAGTYSAIRQFTVTYN